MKDKLTTDKSEKGSEMQPGNNKSNSIGRWVFLLSIFLIITLMVFSMVRYLFFGDKEPLTLVSVKKSYSYENIIPKQIAPVDAFKGPELDHDIYQAQKAYESEQFTLALKHFNKVLTNDPKRFDIKLYAALTQLKLGKDDLAQQLFYQIIEHPDKSLYANEALWYSALIDLNNNNITNCRETLGELISLKTNTKKILEQATTLRDQLEGF